MVDRPQRPKLGPEYNLAFNYPELVDEWHPTLNGDLTPDKMFPRSSKSVWWRCSKCGKEWEAAISNRTNGTGCPRCYKEITPEYNLAFKHPELIDEWHPTLNGELTPDKVFPGSSKSVWWRCSKCGKEWEAKVKNRANGKSGCSKCRLEAPQNTIWPSITPNW